MLLLLVSSPQADAATDYFTPSIVSPVAALTPFEYEVKHMTKVIWMLPNWKENLFTIKFKICMFSLLHLRSIFLMHLFSLKCISSFQQVCRISPQISKNTSLTPALFNVCWTAKFNMLLVNWFFCFASDICPCTNLYNNLFCLKWMVSPLCIVQISKILVWAWQQITTGSIQEEKKKRKKREKTEKTVHQFIRKNKKSEQL